MSCMPHEIVRNPIEDVFENLKIDQKQKKYYSKKKMYLYRIIKRIKKDV